jgi:tetratricopeptide (TPR) repeat protein
MEIHIQLAGVELGPYSEKQVRTYLADALLSPTDPARFEGTETWTTVTDVLAKIAEPVTPAPAVPEKPAPPTIPPQEPVAASPPPSPPAEVRKSATLTSTSLLRTNPKSRDTIRVPLPQIAEALAKQTTQAVRKAIPSPSTSSAPPVPKASEKARTSLLTAVNLLAKRAEPAGKDAPASDPSSPSLTSRPPTVPVTFPKSAESSRTMPMPMGKLIASKSDQDEKPGPPQPPPPSAIKTAPGATLPRDSDPRRTSLLSAVKVLAKKTEPEEKPSIADDEPILPKAPETSATSLPTSKSPQNLRTAPMAIVRALPRKKDDEVKSRQDSAPTGTDLPPGEPPPSEPSVPSTALRFVPPEGEVDATKPAALPLVSVENVLTKKSLRRTTGSLPSLVKALEKKPEDEAPISGEGSAPAESASTQETPDGTIIEETSTSSSPSSLPTWLRSFAQKIGLWRSTEPSHPAETAEIPPAGDEIFEPIDKVTEPVVEKKEPAPKAPSAEPTSAKIESVATLREPATKGVEPVKKQPEPETKPVEPVVKTPEPSTKFVEPVKKQPEPETKPVEPVVKTPEPSTKVVEPEKKQPEPETKPVESSVKTLAPAEPLPEVQPENETTPDQAAESTELDSPAKPTRLSRGLVVLLGVFVVLIGLAAITYSYVRASSVAANTLLQALKDGDQAQLEKVIDFPSVRQSLKDEVAAQLTKPGNGHPAGDSDPAVVLAMIKNSIDYYVTPEAISALATKSDKLPKPGPAPTLLPLSASAILNGLNNLPVKAQSLVSYNQYVIDLDAAKLDLQSTSSGWKLYRIELKTDFQIPSEPGAAGAPVDLGSSLAVPVVETYLQEGKTKFEQSDWDGAIAQFSQVLALDPKQVIAYSNRAMAKRKKGDQDGAIADFTQALSLDPRLAEAYYNRGEAKAAKNDTDGAAADYTQAANLDPKMGMAFYKRGQIRALKGDYDGAIADFTQEIADDPTFADAYSDRGFVRQAQKDLDGAIADYTQALAINPKLAQTYFNRAFAKEAKADLDGAILDYSHALDINPKMTRAYYNRGIAKNTKNDLDGALADYNQALILDPKLAPALTDRALVKQARGDLKGALADLNDALSIDSKIPDAYYSRGLIEEQLNDLDGAINDSTRAIDLDPKRAQAYYNRGFAKLVKGNLDGARQDLQKFCELAPRDPYADHARLYLWLIGMAQNPTGTANQDLSDALQNSWSLGSDDLVTKIAAFLLDRTNEADLIADATSTNQRKDQGQHCEVWYFAGMKRLLAGDKATAIDYFRKCVSTGQKDYCEYILAQAELQVLAPTP